MRTRHMVNELSKFEHNTGRRFLPGTWVVARFDMVGCRRLCQGFDLCGGKYSSDMAVIFNSIAARVMENSGFSIMQALVVNDEINFLISPQDDTFNRRSDDWHGRLASRVGVVAACVLHEWIAQGGFGDDNNNEFPVDSVAFDSRLIEFSLLEHVMDYFSFRFQQAHDTIVDAMFGSYMLRHLELSTVPSGISMQDKEIMLRKGNSVDARSISFLDNIGTIHYWGDVTVQHRHQDPRLTGEVPVIDLERRATFQTPVGTSQKVRLVTDLMCALALSDYMRLKPVSLETLASRAYNPGGVPTVVSKMTSEDMDHVEDESFTDRVLTNVCEDSLTQKLDELERRADAVVGAEKGEQTLHERN